MHETKSDEVLTALKTHIREQIQIKSTQLSSFQGILEEIWSNQDEVMMRNDKIIIAKNPTKEGN